MSFADEDEFNSFIYRDHLLPHVTSDAVAKALTGFELDLRPGKDWAWLAIAVRRSLALTMRHVSDSPERTSDADVRGHLEDLSDVAGSAWLRLFECEDEAESRLFAFAFSRWDGRGGTDAGGGLVIGEPPEFQRYKAAIAELDWLAGFMRDAAKAIDVPRKQWRGPERKALNMQRGQCLAPIFEAAFGRQPTTNNWPSGSHMKPSAFMEFYQRMVALAFGDRSTPNISAVLKAACRRHRAAPVQFADDMISGL